MQVIVPAKVKNLLTYRDVAENLFELPILPFAVVSRIQCKYC
jgi:hypothetical protein